MPAFLDILLFLLPFAAYALWRRSNPRAGLGGFETAMLVIGLLLAVGAAVWYGLGRSMDPGSQYVPAQLENGRVVPGRPGP